MDPENPTIHMIPGRHKLATVFCAIFRKSTDLWHRKVERRPWGPFWCLGGPGKLSETPTGRLESTADCVERSEGFLKVKPTLRMPFCTGSGR